MAYEIYTLSVGTSTTIGFFLFGCLCCALCGKGFDRDRGTSRMIGTGRMRVDGSGWGDEGRGKRSHKSGLFGPDFHSKTRNHELAVGLANEKELGLGASWMPSMPSTYAPSFSWSWTAPRNAAGTEEQGGSDGANLRRGFLRVQA